jgi:hypothetical protein
MKYHIAILALLTLLFTACSKHSPTAASPKLTDLGVVEMSDGSPIHRDLGSGKTCIITPTVITNGIRLAFVIEETNSAGVVQTLATPVMERTPIGRMEVIVGELLRRTPLRYLQPLVYLKRYPGDPAKVQIQIEGAEAAHFWAAALVIPYMVFSCVQNRWGVVFWFVVVQVVGNVYPIFHLRWVRGRLTRVIDKKRQNHAARNA